MVNVIQEKSPIGAHSESSFLYKSSQKYDGQIIYKEVKSDTTTLIYHTKFIFRFLQLSEFYSASSGICI